MHTRQELPYAAAVQLEVFDESRRFPGERQGEGRKAPSSFVQITASVIVDKRSQKKIVIGRGGKMIKQIGTEARKDLQRYLQVDKIFLDLNVKTVPGWRNTDHLLDELGVD
jgi:GTP-binding protein Era